MSRSCVRPMKRLIASSAPGWMFWRLVAVPALKDGQLNFLCPRNPRHPRSPSLTGPQLFDRRPKCACWRGKANSLYASRVIRVVARVSVRYTVRRGKRWAITFYRGAALIRRTGSTSRLVRMVFHALDLTPDGHSIAAIRARPSRWHPVNPVALHCNTRHESLCRLTPALSRR